MPLDARYFVTSDLEGYFVDKDSGLPLAGGTLNFFRDVARTTPKLVYELSGAPPNYTYTALPDPITLSSVGTPQDAGGNNIVIYYFPFDAEGNLDLYYVDVRDSLGVQQFTREAWPNITAASNPTQNDFPVQNQISNAQFTQVFINQSQATVYTVTAATNQVFAFAPDWSFVISGTGTVTVQRIPIAGNNNVPTSPPYVLDVSLSGGITVCNLRQRFNVNSGLWASTANESIFLAGTLIAMNQNAGTTGIQMFYAESTGGLPVIIVDASFDNSAFQLVSGVTAAPIPTSTNTDVGNNGFIDIYLSFEPNSHVRISSVQVVPTIDETGGNLLQFELNSSNREQAFMGDYYIPQLNIRPSPSLLTGWDFPLNPFQFATSGNLTNTATYICDQTIGFAGITGNVGFAKNPVTGGIALTTAGTSDAFYLMQYLSGANAKKILGTPLSVNVFGYRTSVSNDVTMRVYLFRAPSTSIIPTLPTSIGTVASNGVFTLTAVGWTAIPRGGLDTPTAILPLLATNVNINDAVNDMAFTGWQLTDSTQIGDTDKFAIVVTFAYVDAATQITVNSISVIPNAIPARPAEESFDEVLRKCRFYYEKSYDFGIYAGAVSTNGSLIVEQAFAIVLGSTGGVLPLYLPVRYSIPKRIAVTPSIYAVDGTIGNVTAILYQNALTLSTANAVIGNWTLVDNGENGFSYNPVDRSVSLTTAVIGPGAHEGIVQFHFVADARLGIV